MTLYHLMIHVFLADYLLIMKANVMISKHHMEQHVVRVLKHFVKTAQVVLPLL